MTTGTAFDRVLGRVDLVLFTVSAVLTIDGIASAASIGFAWFTWWTILIVLFFIPYGLDIARPRRRDPTAFPGERPRPGASPASRGSSS